MASLAKGSQSGDGTYIIARKYPLLPFRVEACHDGIRYDLLRCSSSSHLPTNRSHSLVHQRKAQVSHLRGALTRRDPVTRKDILLALGEPHSPSGNQIPDTKVKSLTSSAVPLNYSSSLAGRAVVRTYIRSRRKATLPPHVHNLHPTGPIVWFYNLDSCTFYRQRAKYKYSSQRERLTVNTQFKLGRRREIEENRGRRIIVFLFFFQALGLHEGRGTGCHRS